MDYLPKLFGLLTHNANNLLCLDLQFLSQNKCSGPLCKLYLFSKPQNYALEHSVKLNWVFTIFLGNLVFSFRDFRSMEFFKKSS